MAQTGNSQTSNTRQLALARRKAMSGAGKTALKTTDATRQPPAVKAAATPAPAAAPAVSPTASPAPRRAVRTPLAASTMSSARQASLARRKAMSTSGKSAVKGADRSRARPQPKVPAVASASASKEGCGCGCNGNKAATQTPQAVASSRTASRVASSLLKRKPKKVVSSDSCRAGALARRKALSTRGKMAIAKTGLSSAQAARAANPDMSSRELAQTLRDQKSRKGSAGIRKTEAPRRMRPARNQAVGAAQDAPWKVGASDTSHGQTLTGTMVGRSESVTGDEASTCRNITGTEYLGADVFKQFCQAEPAKSISRSGMTQTGLGNSVTGNQVGRSKKVTGDEPGTCKNVTGTEYVGDKQLADFCGTSAQRKEPLTTAQTLKGKTVSGDNVGRSGKVTGDESGANRALTGTQYTRPDQISNDNNIAPAKVGSSATLSGGRVTGSMVGRSKTVTGDEPGSCRNVTGDDYVGQEQYKDFCTTAPERSERKVGMSQTFNGGNITGTMTGRAGKVTGDEPGTCKTVTGTPYAGSEQYQGYCNSEQTERAAAHLQRNMRSAGSAMTGIQPAVGGKMIGDEKGACEAISGTPYIGAEQQAEACPAIAAQPGQADFPQALDAAVSQDFSVASPAAVAQQQKSTGSGVTGSSYEKGSITGPFGMANGKVTGTEEARFSRNAQPQPIAVNRPETVNDRPVSRISGEGQSAGKLITGDDWDRGDRVTGTEGLSASRRNPTRRGPMSAAMPVVKSGRDEDTPVPVSRVTGGSGNTDKGSLVTYSGGARG